MNDESDRSAVGFRSEARLIWLHARKAWAMLPYGVIVEAGNYGELYEKGGVFADLVHCTEVGVSH